MNLSITKTQRSIARTGESSHARACGAAFRYASSLLGHANLKRVARAHMRFVNTDFRHTHTVCAPEGNGSISALLCCLEPEVHSDRKGGGSVTHASRSVPALAVDWQARGRQRGLCWRATRDSVRHVPTGPPKLARASDGPAIAVRGICKPAGKRRFTARTAAFLDRQKGEGIPTGKRRVTAPQIENRLSALPLNSLVRPYLPSSFVYYPIPPSPS
jgi:hypothetical protein